MNDEFIEDLSDTSEEEENINATVSTNDCEDLSSIDSDIGVVENDVSISENICQVVNNNVCIEDNYSTINDSVVMAESNETQLIDYSVSLNNIAAKLDNVVSSISDNKVDFVYDYNYNIVSVLLLSAVVGVLLFSLFTRRF